MTLTIESKFVTGKELSEIAKQGKKVKFVGKYSGYHILYIDDERYLLQKLKGIKRRYQIIKYPK